MFLEEHERKTAEIVSSGNKGLPENRLECRMRDCATRDCRRHFLFA
jgi:hypothetical protein